MKTTECTSHFQKKKKKANKQMNHTFKDEIHAQNLKKKIKKSICFYCLDTIFF